MTVAELTERIDGLLESANSAGKEFDYLAWEADQIPPSDFPAILAVELTFLQDELAKLALDLRTLPVTA